MVEIVKDNWLQSKRAHWAFRGISRPGWEQTMQTNHLILIYIQLNQL